MKKLILLISLLSLVACKTGSVISEKKAVKEKDVLEILNTHYSNTQNFETAYLRGNAIYKDHKQSQNLNIDIRIQKDEKILINLKVLGFTVSKILITQAEVQYYEKINNQYFEGDYDFLSSWLGIELDFNRIQNLLLGQAINDLKKEKLISTIENGFHKIEPLRIKNFKEAYFFEDRELLLKKEEIKQKNKNRKVTINYPNYQKIGSYTLPSEIKIDAEQEKSIHLNLRYEKVTFNEKLNFSYSVPNNYKRININ